MPAPRFRSKGYKMRSIRVPSGRSAVHYERKRAGQPRCGRCGSPLLGVPRADVIRKLSRSSRRPTRPFGGNLCSRCARRLMKEIARG